MKMIWKDLAAPILMSLVFISSLSDTLAGSSESSGELKSESNGGLSGEELWSNNCQRCHNLRSPAMQTPVQWQIIVHHMRVRANITGSDARAIADFLKSASQ